VAAPAQRARYALQGYGYHWKHETMDSEQAGRALAEIQGKLKPELSPSYVLEVPEAPGVAAADIQRVYLLRNRLARLRPQDRGAPAAKALWDELGSLFQK
jgi:hypothetical protein